MRSVGANKRGEVNERNDSGEMEIGGREWAIAGEPTQRARER